MSRLAPIVGLAALLATQWLGLCHDNCASAFDQLDRRTDDEWRKVLKDLVPDSVAAAEIAPALIKILADENTQPILRQQVGMMLGRIGEPAKRAVPKLIAIAQDPNAANRQWSLKALGLFGKVAASTVPEFAKQLQDTRHELNDRILLADVFGQIGSFNAIQSLARTALQETRLNPAQRSRNAELRKALVDALAFSGPASIGALPALVRLLDDDDDDVRRKTCAAIGRLGPQADTTVDALTELLVVDDSPAVQDAAAFALTKMRDSAVPTLERLLRSSVADLQWRAAKSLGQMPVFAKRSLSKLKMQLAVRSNVVRIHVIEAVWRIDHNANNAANRLIAELPKTDRVHQAHAVRLLVEFDALSPADLAALKTLSQSSNPGHRAARQVLKKRSLKLKHQ
jgi:HEAT repeat protein